MRLLNTIPITGWTHRGGYPYSVCCTLVPLDELVCYVELEEGEVFDKVNEEGLYLGKRFYICYKHARERGLVW